MSNQRKPQGGASRPMPYASEYELKRDMGTYQYTQDPAFRQHVYERMAATDFYSSNQQ